MFKIKKMKVEKKHLLVISNRKEWVAELKEGLSIYFEIEVANSVHTGYSIAMDLLPDTILIDQTTLLPKSLKNLSNFKSTHFLKKSYLMLFSKASDKNEVEKLANLADKIFYSNLSMKNLCEGIVEVSSGNSLSNYWKDAFMGLFNIIGNPVVLLQEETIVAMNDSFRQSFKINKEENLKLTDFVSCENKVKAKISLRNFAKGKHMQAVTKTSLTMKNGKTRNAKITFSKLDKMISGQFIMMINFSDQVEIKEKIGSKSEQVERCFEESNLESSFNFSKREKEIIQLLCKGYKTKDISETLFISPKTIEKHRANIIKRTNSETILESIIYAINNDLIDVKVS